MQAALGVSVGRDEATIVLLDAAHPHALITQSRVDLGPEAVSPLTSAVISTNRMVAQLGHRIAQTRVCSADEDRANTFVGALTDAELTDVAAVSQSDAVAELVKSLSGDGSAAVVVADGDTASLSIVDPDGDSAAVIANEPVGETDHLSAYSRLFERFSEQPSGVTSVIVVDPLADADITDWLRGRSPVPVVTPEDPDFAVARGAALAGLHSQPAAPAVSESTDTLLRPQSQKLAYSEVEDHTGSDGFISSVPDTADGDSDIPDRPRRPKILLVGSTLAAVGIIGFAALAVLVAINIRPAASQQAVRTQEETLPGKFFPMSPGQGVQPDGPNWTVIEELPPPGQELDYRVLEPKPLSPALAVESAPIQLKLYSDGTIGLGNNPAGAFAPVGEAPAAASRITGMDLVARLIPDFSRVDLTQVISSVINNVWSSHPLGTMASTLVSLKNAGVIGMVRSNQGSVLTGQPVTVLADSPTALVQKVRSGADTGTLATASVELPARTQDSSTIPQPAEVTTPVLTTPVLTVPSVAAPTVPASEAASSAVSPAASSPAPSTVSAPEVTTSASKPAEEPSVVKSPDAADTSASSSQSKPAESATASTSAQIPATDPISSAPAPASAQVPASSPDPAPVQAPAPASVPAPAPAPVSPATPTSVLPPSPVEQKPVPSAPSAEMPLPQVKSQITTTPVPLPAPPASPS